MTPLHTIVGRTNATTAEPKVPLTEGILAAALIEPLSDRSMSAHKIWIPPNVEYPPHTHPAPHVIYILDGAGWGIIGDKEYRHQMPLYVGDVFFVPENVVHQVGASGSGMVMLAVSSHSLPLAHPDRLKVIDVE